MIRCPHIFMIFSVVFAALVFGAQGSVTIENTRVIYPSTAGEVTVQLHNHSDKPVLLQGWIDAEKEESAQQSAPAAPFILTPPISRVEGQRGQTLRIHLLDDSTLPKDRESMFWINVLDIPVKPGAARDNNVMTVALQSRIKLFFRPKGLTSNPEKAADGLRWRSSQGGIVVTNPGVWHVSLAEIITRRNRFPIDRVSPLASRRFNIPLAAGTPFQFSWLDDHGAVRVTHARIE